MEFTRLCESWSNRLADASRADQQHYAEQFMRLLGWEQPVPFSPREGAQALSAMPYLLRAGGQTTISAFFVMPGALEPPSAVVEAGLDFCTATRLLVDDVAAANMGYLFITDFYRSYLYDARTDELVLHADQPRVFQDEFVPVLKKASVERGALDELRRQPRSVVARQLREWADHWIHVIAREGRISEDTASIVVDRLLTVRYLFARDIFRRTKARLQARFLDLSQRAAAHRAHAAGQDLVHLFHDMWFDWRMDLFAPAPEVDRALLDDAVTVPLLHELNLLSRAKLSIATILESFNHGEPSEKMRVRMVPDANEERDQYLSKLTLETVDEARVDLDLMEEGYRAIFHWFDKLVAVYERLERTYVQQQPRAHEVDLFAWSDLDQRRPNAFHDKLGHACDHGFGLYYNSPRQFRIARLLLTLHLIDRYDQNHQSVDTFPSLDKALMPRPAVLTSGRFLG